MEIDEIGSGKKSQGSDVQRQAEVRRMAQSMAAERMASQVAAQGGAQPQNNPEQEQDAVKLSEKALNNVSARNGPATMQRRDQLLGSIMETLNNELENPTSDFNRRNTKKAGDGDGGGKKKKVEQKKEWQPTAQPGQIHEGREVIGKIRITEEVKEEGGNVGAVGKSAGPKANAKSNSGARPPQAGSGSNSKDKNQSSGGQEGSREAAEASATQSMEKQGLKVEGLEDGGKSKSKGKDKSKIEEQAGGNGSVKEFDVKGRSFGTTQTLTMKPAKELQKGEGSLGTFRKLDDKPMLKYVTLHSRNTGDAVKELKKNASAAGESPEAIEQAVKKLQDKTQP